MPSLTRRDFLKSLTAAVGGALLAACSSQESASPTPMGISLSGASAPTRRWSFNGMPAGKSTRLDDAVKAYMRERQISTGALAVTLYRRLVLARGYSWSAVENAITEPAALFRIASLTRPVTAMAILRLAQEGRLQLDDRLVDILPLKPPPDQVADPRLADVTLLHLLQQRGGWGGSGLGDGSAFDPAFADLSIASALGASLPLSQAQIIEYMNGQPLLFAPGSQFDHNPYGYVLLGRVIEAVSGQPYPDYVQQSVLAPLGIQGMRLGRSLAEFQAPGEVTYNSSRVGLSVFRKASVPVPLPYGGFNLENMDSHSGWLASVVDLARFLAAFDNPSAHPVLDEAFLQAMFAPPQTGPQAEGWYYGCGWFVRGEAAYQSAWHVGSLPGSYAYMGRKVGGLSWVALFNQSEDAGDPSGARYADIAWRIENAANETQDWPSEDFFP